MVIQKIFAYASLKINGKTSPEPKENAKKIIGTISTNLLLLLLINRYTKATLYKPTKIYGISQIGPLIKVSVSSIRKTIPVKIEIIFKIANKIAGIKINLFILLTIVMMI